MFRIKQTAGGRMDYDSMEAGREMDRLVAEKVMGEKIPKGWEYNEDEKQWENEEPDVYSDGTFARSWSTRVWPDYYSTSISAAWEVVEKMNRYFYLTPEIIGKSAEAPWYCIFQGKDTTEDGAGRGDTAPLAICRAALKAVAKEE